MNQWEHAVSEAAHDRPADLTEAARVELEWLWGDLDHEIQYALRGGWSIKCDTLAARIAVLSSFVGATNWRDVQAGLLQNGVYQGILRSVGVEFEEPDMAQVNALADRIKASPP